MYNLSYIPPVLDFSMKGERNSASAVRDTFLQRPSSDGFNALNANIITIPACYYVLYS
jgi:hypothetical protein